MAPAAPSSSRRRMRPPGAATDPRIRREGTPCISVTGRERPRMRVRSQLAGRNSCHGILMRSGSWNTRSPPGRSTRTSSPT